MKSKSLMLTTLLAFMGQAMWAQDNYFSVASNGYIIIDDTAAEVRLVGKVTDMDQATTYTGDGIVPDEVSYGGKTYKVVEFGYFDRQNGDIRRISLGKNVRKVDIFKPNFPMSGGWTVVESNPYLVSDRGILYSAGYNKLIHCPAHLTIPGAHQLSITQPVQEISEYACCYQQKLTELHLPTSLQIIRSYAFEECTNMKGSLEIPIHVNRIEDYAFRNTGFEEVSLPTGLQFMGNGVFSGTKITSLTLPLLLDSLSSLGYISGLKKVECLSLRPPKSDEISIQNFKREVTSLYSDVLLVVPKGCLDVYKQDECWGLFKNIVESGDGYEPCAVPTIQYVDGKIICTSETSGAECVTTITAEDAGTYDQGEITLKCTYLIETFAKRDGFLDSFKAYATLFWMDKDLDTDEISVEKLRVKALPVLVKYQNNMLSVEGATNGTEVAVYGVDGEQLGQTVSHSGQASIRINAKSVSVVIVKVGRDAMRFIVR